MPRKQTRRSISVSKETYDALQKKTCELGVSGSGWVESVIRPLLGLEAEEPSVRRETKSRVHSVSPTPSPTPEPKPEPAPVPKPAPKVEITPATEPIPAKVFKTEHPIYIKVNRKDAPAPKEPPPGDLASKIFTF